MIVGISIKNFKGIQKIAPLALSRFHVLVGSNGAGKTTFLDAIDFVRDCLTQGPEAAVASRLVSNFNDLTWMRRGGAIEIELWLDLSDQGAPWAEHQFWYRLAIRQDPQHEVCVEDEELRKCSPAPLPTEGSPELRDRGKSKRLLGKTAKGTDFYAREKGTHQDFLIFA